MHSLSEDNRMSGPGLRIGEFPRKVDFESQLSSYFKFKALIWEKWGLKTATIISRLKHLITLRFQMWPQS